MTLIVAGRCRLPGENGMKWNDGASGATACGAICGPRVAASVCRFGERLGPAA
jgi:hypothetical protein